MALTHVESVAPGPASGASVTVTFGAAPAEGELIVLCAQAANAGADYLFQTPAGFTPAYAAVSQTYRSVAEFYKVAGASEPDNYTLSIVGSTTLLGYGRRYSGTLASVNAQTPAFLDTDEASITITATASVGSAIVATGYSSLTEASPKSWNAGWINQLDPSTTNKYSSVQKISAGGSETATMTLVSGTNNRLALTFVEYVSSAGDTVNPLISSAAAAADGGSVTINFSESVDVGAGGSGGFTVPATYGTITLTPTTTLPASSVVFSTSRVLQNGETISGAFAQPGDGVEDAAGNDLASGTFAITNGSLMHQIFSDAAKTIPYSAGDVRAYTLTSESASVQTLTPSSGYVQMPVNDQGTYRIAWSSIDGAILGVGNHIVP